MTRFTVGYTIFNKANLIPDIIDGLKKCFSKDDEFIFLFDSCVDRSLEVFKEQNLEGYNYQVIIPEGEQFEIKSNNRILKEAVNDVIILFQDDMLCLDPSIKDKVTQVLNYFGDSLGLLGGRDGFELRSISFPEKPVDMLSSWTHGVGGDRTMLSVGEFGVRTILNRGPVVFTRRLLDTVGYLNEDYYPQWGDDMDYCMRCKYKYGLSNVVFQANIRSDLEWGGMRGGFSKLRRGKFIRNNWLKFVKDWGYTLLEEAKKSEVLA